MQTKQTHWSSLLTLLVVGISLAVLILLVAAMGIASLMDLFSKSSDAASPMIGAFAFGFIALLLVLCGWFVLEKTRGLEKADLPFKLPFALWHWAVIIPLVGFGILFGALITLAKFPWLNWLVLPTLTILVIVPPIWLLFGTASNGIELGPRWRFFSILSLSMTVAPVIMIVLEIVILLAIIIAGVVYIAMTQPDLVYELESMALFANENMSEEALLAWLTPYITNPYLIGTGIGYIAVIVPLIEELLKPLAVWLFARQIDSPAQGFAMGVLSGAGFALVESLNASADGGTSWAVIVAARTGTSMLHMLTSGLVGWGIVSAFKEKRAGRFFAAYFSAILIHGIWNASAIGTGISAIGESVGRPEWLFNYAPALLCGLMIVGIGVVTLLIAFNRKLRKQTELAISEEMVESPA
ncbi:MAG: hypothetical protein OHK003_31610 [Anaerolineales bacterium]